MNTFTHINQREMVGTEQSTVVSFAWGW